LRGWRLLAIDGFEVDLPDSKEDAAEFGYAGSRVPVGVPQGPGVAMSECGTHAFLAAEIGSYSTGEKAGPRTATAPATPATSGGCACT
jgi:hypothetical protein